jgi:hypothetical protein
MLTVESSKYGVTFTITPRIAKPYEISGRGSFKQVFRHRYCILLVDMQSSIAIELETN